MRPTKHVPIVAGTRRDARWRALVAKHSDAVDAYASAAEMVSAVDWPRRPAPETWSPGEITMHLVLSSEAALRELAGGPPMAPRLSWWMRPIVRWTILPRILRRKGFPAGVRAPRETRPGGRLLDSREAIALFRQRAAELELALDEARRRGSGVGLTHPHFGRLDLEQAFGLLVEHVRHHGAQLDRVHRVLATGGPAAQ